MGTKVLETVQDKSSAFKKKLEKAIDDAKNALINDQNSDGHWCYELEADATIPAEYILMMHFVDEVNTGLEQKIAVYLRRNQNKEGGWPLYYGGKTDLSCSVKAYYALKIAGDDPDEEHMKKARETILKLGGAAKSNVFTRIMLAQFDQIPWRGVPFIPVETMLFPRWFFFHLSKVSYWSRTVMVPLFILYSKRATAINPRNVHIQELFTTPPDEETDYFPTWSTLNKIILGLERIGYTLQPLIPRFLTDIATKKAEKWFVERLNGESGLGAIFPAMVNAYEALKVLGYPDSHEYVKTAKKALDLLVVEKTDEAYCQPCVSPVWDTLLSVCALQHIEDDKGSNVAAEQGLAWLKERQLTDEYGDWKDDHPDLEGGGWPFQYANDYYPDLDDTAFAAYGFYNSAEREQYSETIERAAKWLKGMQSGNGGFAAFDSDNEYYYLNEIPFADHGALLDPPTADVSARCLMFFGQIVDDYPDFKPIIDKTVSYLTSEQEEDGSWFGRWGTNYIYGTWSVLFGFEKIGIDKSDPRIAKAVYWLKSKQQPDGGWGEDNWSYHDPATAGEAQNSTSFQTAWALLALMAVGETKSEAVKRGIRYLVDTQDKDGFWYEPDYTCPGFPKVFYLKYHGYNKYFPLWALARYHQEMNNSEPDS